MTRAILAVALAAAFLIPAAPASAAGVNCGNRTTEWMDYSYGARGVACRTARKVGRKMSSIPMDRASFRVNGRRWFWVNPVDGARRIVARSRGARVILTVHMADTTAQADAACGRWQRAGGRDYVTIRTPDGNVVCVGVA